MIDNNPEQPKTFEEQVDENTPTAEHERAEQGIDDIMEDLMVGHNFEYAGKALKELVAKEVAAARRNELALFAQKFIKEDSVGSTPSDLVQPEPYIEADDDEIIAYVDERLAQLAQKPKEGGSREVAG